MMRWGFGKYIGSQTNGKCVSQPVTRCTGASSRKKHRSVIVLTISAPKPHVSEASWVTMSRPVLFTLFAMHSTSHGAMDCKSITCERTRNQIVWWKHFNCMFYQENNQTNLNFKTKLYLAVNLTVGGNLSSFHASTNLRSPANLWFVCTWLFFNLVKTWPTCEFCGAESWFSC